METKNTGDVIKTTPKKKVYRNSILKLTFEGSEVKVYDKMITACIENKISYDYMRKEISRGGYLFHKGFKYERVPSRRV